MTAETKTLASMHTDYYIGIDHIRALAVFLVFSWHFFLNTGHQNIPIGSTFTFPLNSLITQGFTGVSIFMVLSGYLLAKITDSRVISWKPFLLNRVWRLLPLLLTYQIIYPLYYMPDAGWPDYVDWAKSLAVGVVLPTLPVGGWFITVQFHCYLIFVFLSLSGLYRPYLISALILTALLVRIAIYAVYGGEALHELSYMTIIGRLDQFLCGILFCRFGRVFKDRHALATVIIISFVLFWSLWDRSGGFYNASNKGAWLILPLAEGLVYGVLIAWYDRSFIFSQAGLSGLLSKIGRWSYSIYLMHFYVIYVLFNLIDRQIPLNNFYVAFFFNTLCFAFTCALASFSYKHLELRFLKFRVRYLDQH